MKTISILVFNLLPFKDNLVLILDRINWKYWSKNIITLILGLVKKPRPLA
jgi:hypothetical protein